MKNNHAGFTIIEVLFVMIVSGIILVALLSMYQQYIVQKRIDDTKESIKEASSQISYFFSNTLRYPCPSNRILGVNDPAFGQEFDADCVGRAESIGPGNCAPGGGFCVYNGLRDADGDGAMDLVAVGGLPINAFRQANGLKVDSSVAHDGYDSLITYAVTLSMTNPNTFNFNRGVIRALDEFGLNTAGIIDDAHFVIVSHGANKSGAFSLEGGLTVPCGTDVQALDNENCDGDGVFMRALGFSRGNNTSFHDDFAFFAKSESSTLWTYIPGTNDIQNTNVQNVGIGTTAPTKKLEVNGDIRADNSTVVDQICMRSDPSKCFNVSAFSADVTTTENIECGPGLVLTGLSEAAPQCGQPSLSAIKPDINCGPERWIHGFTSSGDPICWP